MERSLGSVFLLRPASVMALGWVMFTLSWLLPNHYIPWLNFPSEALALSATAVLVAGLLLTGDAAAIRWPLSALCVSGAALLPWIQWALGISSFAGDALMVSLYLTAWATAVVVGYHLCQEASGQPVLWLMHMLWIAALVSAMVGLLQWLRLEEHLGIFAAQTDPGDPVMGNLAQPNQLATLLLIGMVAYGYIYERRVIGSMTLALGILFMTGVLVMTHSRTGMIGLLAVSGFLFVKRSSANSRIGASHFMVWGLMFAIMYVLSPLVDHVLHLDMSQEPVFTLNGRTQIWLQTLEGVRNAPWTGYGWNQTFSAISAGILAHPSGLVATYAHSLLLDALAWNGLPIGLILIGMGAYWFCSRLYRVAGTPGTYAMAGLLPITLHSMVELPFAYAYFLLAAGLLMGVVEASIANTRIGQTRRIWIGLALFMWVLVGATIAYEYLLIEEDTRVTRFENLRVGATDSSYHPPSIRLLTHMAALQRATRQQPAPHMTAQQLDDMRQAVTRFPNGGMALRYAMSLGMNGDAEGARHMMKLIRALYGADFYVAAKYTWIEQFEKNPDLKAIRIPD